MNCFTMLCLRGMLILLNMACIGGKTIETSTGTVSGTTQSVNGKDVETYLGIPFAEPPTGTRRFKRPEPKAAWEGVYDANMLPNSCPQAIDNAFGTFEGATMWNANTKISEDCLYLNLWVPTSGQTPKSTMVWIYGGGFWSGTSTLELYDGSILATENDIIVVSIQYRVLAFGFLFLDDIGAPGNMALVDQQVALKWINDNIEAFGGDKNKITLVGESSGAAAVGMHLLSPGSWDLFNYAILESASPLVALLYSDPTTLKATSLEVAASLGCDHNGDVQKILECLYTKDMQDIINSPMVNTMTNDNFFITKPISELIENKEFKKTPILLGNNKDEGTYFLVYYVPRTFNFTGGDDLTKAEYDAQVQFLAFGNTAADQALQKGYGEFCKGLDYIECLAGMWGDSWFVCPTLGFAEAYADEENVFFYHYTHRTSANPWPAWGGVMHGYEIDMVFGRPLNSSLGYTSDEMALSRRVMQYWTNFAKTGNPNGINDQVWQPFGENKNYLDISTEPPTMKMKLREAECKLWNDVIGPIWAQPEGKE